MKKISFNHSYDYIISVENLLKAWREFIRGKRSRRDVQEFELHLMSGILDLNTEFVNFTYQHSGYHAFKISDPKPRNIHKAGVRDRLLHHAIYRQLYPFFDKTFIADSFSCRNGKGTHKAINRFRNMAYRVSKNHAKTVWVLKCDIKKFFASIDHSTLLYIIGKYIEDENVTWLLSQIITSFDKGLPLGNLTSQLLVNIYMNEFDQFVKHELRVKYYIRYADDFVLLSSGKTTLCKSDLHRIRNFLENKLKLSLHPDKVFIKTLASGVDFLGWVHFPKHRVLRTVTKRRMMKNLSRNNFKESITSYRGMLKWGNTYKIRKNMLYN